MAQHEAPDLAELDESDDAERRHFLEVCWSCFGYWCDAMREVARFQTFANALDSEDLALWGKVPEFSESLEACIKTNTRFLNMMPTPDVCGSEMTRRQEEQVYRPPPDHRPASRNTSKVRSTLKQFVRDWAAEGQDERDAAYGPLIQALDRHLPAPAPGSRARKPRVLCPGSGLGRLPFELARMGYAAQGNEFSYHMLLGSHLIYNRTQKTNCYTIYPHALSTVNRKNRSDALGAVTIPDVCPILSLHADSDVSMAAGEFVAVYHNQKEEWDAVVTPFFIDTAKNIFLYIRTIAGILRPGGLWTNLGPLLYHFADVDNEVSIELSWEELRPAIAKYFDFIEEERREAKYTCNPKSMMRTVFRCIFFAARRNKVPVSGSSNDVY